MRHAFLVTIIMLVLGSCTGGEDSIFHNIPEQGWAYRDTLSFAPMQGQGTLLLAVRHDAAYPYSNLWLEVSARDPRKGVILRDTVNLRLSDRFGRWLGKGFGGSYQLEVPVSGSVSLDSASVVNVRHIMRLDTVRGLDQVGIRLSSK